jgi:hypothetical protein
MSLRYIGGVSAPPDKYARRRCILRLGLLGWLTLAGCGGAPDDDSARGRGLPAAELTVDAQASIYEAAVRASFDLGPDLTLLLEPRYLPRAAGQAGGEETGADLLAALRRRGVVQGSCEPPHDGTRAVPVCPARGPGYVVRFSEVFRGAGDTVQVHMSALRFRTAAAEPAEALSFERAYQLTGSGRRWVVVREARVLQ